jgi:uncharacterized protein (TIGR02678 family)
VAGGVRAVDLADYQRVVRLLLTRPVVTSSTKGKGLEQVRRWEATLREDLATVFDYRLDVTPTCARLVRRPVVLDPTRPLRTATQSARSFDRRRYAYLCLVLAVLQGAGLQVLVTDLADRVRRRAEVIARLGFDDANRAHRMAFVDAVGWLEGIGALVARDGHSGDYAKDPEQDALLDIDAEMVHLLAPVTLRARVGGSSALFPQAAGADRGRDAQRRGRRQAVCRWLVDRPVVTLGDLPPDEAAYLRREARTIAADIERLTGATVERRSEGLVLLDAGGELTDRRFPGGGTISQVALLLAERLVALGWDDDERPATALPALGASDTDLALELSQVCPAGPELGALRSVAAEDTGLDAQTETDAEDSGHGGPDAGHPEVPFATWTEMTSIVTDLATRYGSAFKKGMADDPERLCRLAVDELKAFDLVRPVAGGVALVPPIARYRTEVTFSPAASPAAGTDPAPTLWSDDA